MTSKKTTTKGLAQGWTRVTFILKEEHIEKLKAISYWDRITIKEIMNEVLSNYLENKEMKISKKHKQKDLI